ncbi:MAG TPA: archease [Stellaceae bacterium]|nr:archease [Stellaceae bacterium]
MAVEPHAEQFPHGADIGVRGVGPTVASAFEQAALALSSSVTDIGGVRAEQAIDIACEAPTTSLLLFDWLNRVIYEMALRHMVFGRFSVAIEGGRLHGRAWGERVDPRRHAPAVEPKGATFTALAVEQRGDGTWIAQCVVDV